MFTLTNPNECRSRTAVAKEAMRVGAIAVQEKGTAKGEPLQVRKLIAGDIQDAALKNPNAKLGIVFYIPDDDMVIDYIIDPITKRLTVNTGADNTFQVPATALVEFIRWEPVVRVTKDDVSATLKAGFDAVREGDLIGVAFENGNPLLTKVTDATTELVLGYVHMHHGTEVEIVLTALR